jgi:hypothetical protein
MTFVNILKQGKVKIVFRFFKNELRTSKPDTCVCTRYDKDINNC